MLTQPNRSANRQWKMLLIYNIYRLVCIIALFCLFWFSSYSQINDLYYNLLLSLYFFFSIFCIEIARRRTFKLEHQVLWFGTVDIVLIAFFIDSIGHLESGFGIILFATIAVLSILAPGRIGIYFASVASVMLLMMNLFDYEYHLQYDLAPFFATGIYGAGFFATALATWYLASRVRVSELMAEQWSNELISILRVGEYFVEQFKNGVIYIESDGQVRLINNTVRQYFNIKKSSLPASIERLMPAIFPAYKAFVSKRKKRKEYAQTILDDLNLHVEFFSVSIDAQTSVLIILEDLAVVAQQAQQFKLASLGRFSASIAHELRNPLGIISHAAQLMGEKLTLDDENLRLKELIVNNCNRMNRVIKNVLQLSRQQPSKPEPIDLSLFLESFKHEFSLINTCDITIVIPRKAKKNILFDKSQLNQILVILCDNAMQHGVNSDEQVSIAFSIEHKGQEMRLNICDTGKGIPYSKREIIFEPFFTTSLTGNGMGLFIAKDLCELNGARLILSQVEQGCCFSLIFNHHNEILL